MSLATVLTAPTDDIASLKVKAPHACNALRLFDVPRDTPGVQSFDDDG